LIQLVARNGKIRGRAFKIESGGQLVFGRTSREGLLPDTRVSRKHARISQVGEQWIIEDLGSSNGTHINGHRIPQSTQVRVGDLIEMGRLIILVNVIDDAVEASPKASPSAKPKTSKSKTSSNPILPVPVKVSQPPIEAEEPETPETPEQEVPADEVLEENEVLEEVAEVSDEPEPIALAEPEPEVAVAGESEVDSESAIDSDADSGLALELDTDSEPEADSVEPRVELPVDDDEADDQAAALRAAMAQWSDEPVDEPEDNIELSEIPEPTAESAEAINSESLIELAEVADAENLAKGELTALPATEASIDLDDQLIDESASIDAEDQASIQTPSGDALLASVIPESLRQCTPTDVPAELDRVTIEQVVPEDEFIESVTPNQPSSTNTSDVLTPALLNGVDYQTLANIHAPSVLPWVVSDSQPAGILAEVEQSGVELGSLEGGNDAQITSIESVAFDQSEAQALELMIASDRVADLAKPVGGSELLIDPNHRIDFAQIDSAPAELNHAIDSATPTMDVQGHADLGPTLDSHAEQLQTFPPNQITLDPSYMNGQAQSEQIAPAVMDGPVLQVWDLAPRTATSASAAVALSPLDVVIESDEHDVDQAESLREWVRQTQSQTESKTASEPPREAPSNTPSEETLTLADQREDEADPRRRDVILPRDPAQPSPARVGATLLNFPAKQPFEPTAKPAKAKQPKKSKARETPDQTTVTPQDKSFYDGWLSGKTIKVAGLAALLAIFGLGIYVATWDNLLYKAWNTDSSGQSQNTSGENQTQAQWDGDIYSPYPERQGLDEFKERAVIIEKANQANSARLSNDPTAYEFALPETDSNSATDDPFSGSHTVTAETDPFARGPSIVGQEALDGRVDRQEASPEPTDSTTADEPSSSDEPSSESTEALQSTSSPLPFGSIKAESDSEPDSNDANAPKAMHGSILISPTSRIEQNDDEPALTVDEALGRTVFLADASSTMVDSMSSMLEELNERIEELDESQAFVVIFFQQDRVVEHTIPGLHMADTVGKKRFQKWLLAEDWPIQPGGRCDASMAINHALTFEPTRIVILSDNRFGRNPGVNEKDLVAQLADQLQGKEIRLEAVQFFYEDRQQVLQRLVDEIGGRYTFIQSDQDEITRPLPNLFQNASDEESDEKG